MLRKSLSKAPQTLKLSCLFAGIQQHRSLSKPGVLQWKCADQVHGLCPTWQATASNKSAQYLCCRIPAASPRMSTFYTGLVWALV